MRAIGHRSLGLGYSLVARSDSGRDYSVQLRRELSVIFPSLELWRRSTTRGPVPTAALLGTYLMLTIYHGDLVACAMFITGQASNPLAADLALKTAQVKINRELALGGPAAGVWPASWRCPGSYTVSRRLKSVTLPKRPSWLRES